MIRCYSVVPSGLANATSTIYIELPSILNEEADIVEHSNLLKQVLEKLNARIIGLLLYSYL